MTTYTFATDLLSAASTGYPNLIGTSLSATAVTFLSGDGVSFATQLAGLVSLSSVHEGISFNPTTVTIATTSLSTFSLTSYPTVAVTVAGSVVNIPAALNSSTLTTVNVDESFTVFPWLSTTTTIPTSALSATNQVSVANTRRLRFLGY